MTSMITKISQGVMETRRKENFPGKDLKVSRKIMALKLRHEIYM